MTDADPSWRGLLAPLAGAEAALARLAATLALGSAPVAEGLRARIACREAAGWLAHLGTWVHPVDLAMREAGLAGSYAAAATGVRLPSVLPQTLAARAGQAHDPLPPDPLPEDATVEQALLLARLWRRLAELPSWGRPGAAEGIAALLRPLHDAPPQAIVAAWHDAAAAHADLPPLLRAGLAAADWTRLAGGEARADRLSRAGLLLAAALWREAGSSPALPLPLWSAPPDLLHRLGLAAGGQFLPGFLGAVTAAAEGAARELARLRAAEQRMAALACTARSHLPGAAALALRVPVLTRRTLATGLGVSPQAALDLLDRLVRAGVLREATGRAGWRVFVLS